MSYNIETHEQQFVIKAENEPQAVEAFKQACDKRMAYSKYSIDLNSCTSLAECLRKLGYEPCRYDNDGNIVAIFEFVERLWLEPDVLEAMAPFVEAGSFINVSGEDNAQWQYSFDGKAMTEKQGRIVFD